MVLAYVYMKVSEYPPPNPVGSHRLPMSFAMFFVYFPFGLHHKIMNQIFASTDERYTTRYITIQVRSGRCLYGTYSLFPLNHRYSYVNVR